MTEVLETNSSNVDIIVRCAFQTGVDIHVSCPPSWTIKELKEHLHDVCSLHPAVSTQRLIYSGACLTDDLTVQSILDKRQFDGNPVFHLVCPLNHTSPELRRREATSSGRTNSSNPPQTQFTWNAQYVRPFASSPSDTANYAEAYHAYYSWYMSNYAQMMAYYQHAASAATPSGSAQSAYAGAGAGAGFGFPLFGPNGGAFAAQPQAAHAAGGNEPVAAPQAQQPNIVQGEDGADGRGGDFLDLLYRGFRIMIFLSVVWLYSSIERFLIVFSIGLFIYFMKLRREQQAAVAAANPPPPPVNNNNNGEVGGNIANAGDEASGVQIFLSTCYSFVTSFFTSIVPENPVPANLN